MIGYIYLTTNLIDNKMYVGKHKSSTYDSKYYGSGKIIKRAIKKYGKENFKNEVLYEADTIEELDFYEKYYIKKFRDEFGRSNLYNIANGGEDGDTISGKSEEEKRHFKNKMTAINRSRCASSDFKEKLSKATSLRYKDPKERKSNLKKLGKCGRIKI